MADEEKQELAKADAEEDSSSGGCCSCCGKCIVGFFKFLLCLVLTPVFIVLLVVAVVVYIITLPLKCCSPCFLPCLVAITELVKKIAMIPYKLMRWVCGRSTADEDDEPKKKDAKNYGAAEDAEKADG